MLARTIGLLHLAGRSLVGGGVGGVIVGSAGETIANDPAATEAGMLGSCLPWFQLIAIIIGAIIAWLTGKKK